MILIADIEALNILYKAVLEITAIASRTIPLVRPNSLAK